MPDRIIRAIARTRVVRSPQGRTRVVDGGARTRVVAGARGLRGPAGLPQPPISYTHTQSGAAQVWTVNHNLGLTRPLVHVFSTGGEEVEAEVLPLNANQVQITFAAPFAGSARCI